MPKDRPDFIHVRISDHALARLGDEAAVGITNAHMHYLFQGATSIEILRRPEWHMLQHEMFDGQPLFQEAEPSSTTNPSDDEA